MHRRRGGEGTPGGIDAVDEPSTARSGTGNHLEPDSNDRCPGPGPSNGPSPSPGPGPGPGHGPGPGPGSERFRSISDAGDQQSHLDHDQSADHHHNPTSGDLRRNVESPLLTRWPANCSQRRTRPR